MRVMLFITKGTRGETVGGLWSYNLVAGNLYRSVVLY